jgi:ribulose-phosphate 3-epimerase
MDGVFVPNLTYGMPIVQAVRRVTDLPLDVHLMITDPTRYVDQFFEAGADVITFHAEAVPDPRPLLRRIRELGAGAGLSLNPETPVSRIEGCVHECDLILAMSVPAGFGAQAFHEEVLEKVQQLDELTDGHVMLEVDGGVNESTIGRCAQAGARCFVVGSAIFRTDDYGPVVERLNHLARSPQG